MGCLFLVTVLALVLFFMYRRYRIQDFYPVAPADQELSPTEIEKKLNDLKRKIVELERTIRGQRPPKPPAHLV